MEGEPHIYDSRIIVSPHTNKPINTPNTEKTPIFWCGVCNLKLCSGPHCWQHMHGQLHKNKEQKLQKGESLYTPFDSVESKISNGISSQRNNKKKRDGNRQRNNYMTLDVENPAYGPETVISIHTNKPVTSRDENLEGGGPVFWCGLHNLRFSSGPHCWQHMTGRLHKTTKKGRGTFSSDQVTGDGGIFKEPPLKKSKQVPGELFVAF